MENANIYVWHGANSEESGKTLATLLGTENVGTHPPKDFTGVLVCFGSKPSEKFKWEERNVRAVLNDPRTIRKYVDRGEMFAALDKAGFSVPKTIKIAKNVMNFDQACNQVGSTPSLGLAAFNSTGSNARPVRTSAEFVKAVADKMVYASHPDFLRPNRIRALVVDGVVVGSLIRDNGGNPSEFAQKVSEELKGLPETNPAMIEALTLRLIEGGYVVPSTTVTYWRMFNALHPKMQDAAIKAAKALGYDLCAVDMCFLGEENVAVMNVVSTPDIVSHKALHAPLTDTIKLWMKRCFRSAKELLNEIADKATEEEAEAIVQELRQAKAQTA